MAQVRLAIRLPCFTYSPSHSHSAHASTSTDPTDPSSPRPPSPGAEGKRSTPSGSVSGASTGPTNGKSDGAIYFECLNCKRQVSWILCVYPSTHFSNTSDKTRSTCRTDRIQPICSSSILLHGSWQRKPSWRVAEPRDKVQVSSKSQMYFRLISHNPKDLAETKGAPSLRFSVQRLQTIQSRAQKGRVKARQPRKASSFLICPSFCSIANGLDHRRWGL